MHFIYDALRHALNRPNKFDGRWVLAGALLLYFFIILIGGLAGDYGLVWRRLGVPVMKPGFADLRILLAGFDCTRQGYNVLLENPCDLWNRTFNYPKIWLGLTPLGLDQGHAVPLGVFMAFVFYAVTFWYVGKLHPWEGLLYSLFLCSYPSMLLVERGNIDLIIFCLLAVSLKFYQSRGRIIKGFSFAGILLGAFLKLYPIFALVVFLRESKKKFLNLLSFGGIIFGTYFWIQSVSSQGPLYEPSRADYLSYGWRIIFTQWIADFAEVWRLTMSQTSPNFEKALSVLSLFLMLAIVGASLFFLVQFLIWVRDQWKKNFQVADSLALDSFRVGTAIFLGTFVLNSNFDYRMVFLLFTLPQLIQWIKSGHEMGQISLGVFIALFFTFQLSNIYALRWFNLDESLNWFLFLFYGFIFFETLPNWKKGILA